MLIYSEMRLTITNGSRYGYDRNITIYHKSVLNSPLMPLSSQKGVRFDQDQNRTSVQAGLYPLIICTSTTSNASPGSRTLSMSTMPFLLLR